MHDLKKKKIRLINSKQKIFFLFSLRPRCFNVLTYKSAIYCRKKERMKKKKKTSLTLDFVEN